MTRIRLDGAYVETASKTVSDLIGDSDTDTIAIVNGRHVEKDAELSDGDSVVLIRHIGYDRELASLLLSERYPSDAYERISAAKVGVSGLGGIGSHVAEALVRAGVRKLVIADFDEVDITNLNRQNYCVDDIGRSKTSCTADRLRRIDPGIELEVFDGRITSDNASDVFEGCSIVCEAFDSASSKAMLIETLLSNDDDVKVVSVSGMAGFGPVDSMVVSHPMSRLYVCGDLTTDSGDCCGLTATRVMACAGMAAHTALRIIIGLE